MAGYVRPINKNTLDSHQTSPGYVITCLRFSNRDTYNYENKTKDPLETRKPLVIINDAIQVSVTNTKSGYHTSMTAQLKGGDLNYATALSPGDYILVNMVNWEEQAFKIATRAANLQQINRQNDGFKGVFKIQTVRKNLIVNPTAGVKSLIYTIHAAGFTEFDNVIHYNPAIKSAFAEAGHALYQIAIGEFFQNLLISSFSCQKLVKNLFKILIGKSEKDNSTEIHNYGNTHFKVPKSLGRLLGNKDIKYASDLYNYVIGLWQTSTTNDKTLSAGMNPNFTNNSEDSNNIFETGKPILGDKQISIEDWNNNQTWSIIQGNINSTLNEMYSTYRINKNGDVMPTVIVRQKPFTTPHFKDPDGYTTSRYFDVPRWKISPDLLTSMDIGQNEAARYNFVQVFSAAVPSIPNLVNLQIAMKNFEYDENDIQKHGLKPYIKTTNFNFPMSKGADPDSSEWKLHAPAWAKIVSDWVLAGHLKTSGTLNFMGIVEPISIGDNIELDNTIYHIESITHVMAIVGDKKSFRTNLTVSYGMDMRSNKNRPVYPEMEHTYSWTNLKTDQADKDAGLLPGISNTQLSLGRKHTDGEETENTEEESFTLSPKKRAVKPNPTTVNSYGKNFPTKE